MLKTVLTSLTAFVSTALDDIFILMIICAQTEKPLRKIIPGYLAGIALLASASALASCGVMMFSEKLIGLMGIIPIVLGINQWRENKKEDSSKGEEAALPAGMGVIKTALLTLSNGADNIGIYIPVFSGYNGADFMIMAAVFAAMSILWCIIADILAKTKYIGDNLRKYSRIIVPCILILLGVFILLDGFVFK